MKANFKILLVDDKAEICELTKHRLLSLGFTDIDMAHDGYSAYKKLESDPHYHLILSDLKMPNWNGLTLLKSIKENLKLKDTYFIFFSAEFDPQLRQEAMNAGAQGFFDKPSDWEHMLLHVQMYFYQLSKVAA